MSKENVKQNKAILKMYDDEGRRFSWIAKKLGISETVVRRNYYRGKAKISIKERQQRKENDHVQL